ncbi:MAG: 2-iminobutanoate/2-iminopropanoate deaminase [Lysobacterales bacterium]|jgi:2-iminobutanoate/2-iminopropanoate deaminase
MSKEILTTNQAPVPIGPYNQAVRVGNLVYTSGQIPLDVQTGEIVSDTIEGQTTQVLTYLKAILENAGTSLDKVVKTTVFIKDMGSFPQMNKIYGKFFKEESAPARSTVEVARLPKDVLVEIEAIAEV